MPEMETLEDLGRFLSESRLSMRAGYMDGAWWIGLAGPRTSIFQAGSTMLGAFRAAVAQYRAETERAARP